MKIKLLVFWWSILFCNTALSQSPAEEILLRKLRKGPDVTNVLEAVLQQADGYSALVLFESAQVAFKQERLEDSAFLFYAGQLRYRFDLKCFPPKGTGGNSPFHFYAVRSNNLGMMINPAIMAEPKLFTKVLAKIKKWIPLASESYDPGYEYLERKTGEHALGAHLSDRGKFLEQMEPLSALLNDAEYFAAFRIVQSRNLAPDEKRPTTKAYRNATKTIVRIEKERELIGIGASLSSEEFSAPPVKIGHKDLPSTAENETVVSDSSAKDSPARDAFRAVAQGDLPALRALLESKVDINEAGKNGLSILLTSIVFEQKECFEYLLANGADPNQQSLLGDSPISVAANKELGKEYWLKSIIKNGGNPNLLDDKVDPDAAQFGFSKTTPLFDALRAMNVNNVKLLVDAGAKVHWKDDRGLSLLAQAVAIQQFDIALVLLKHEADYEGKAGDGKTIREFLTSYDKNSLSREQKEDLLHVLKFIEEAQEKQGRE